MSKSLSLVSRSTRALMRLTATAAAVLVVAMVSAATAQQTFKSADEAADALVNAVKAGDEQAMLAVLGPEGEDIISSGDPVDDAATRKLFLAAYDAGHHVAVEGDKALIIIGPEDFPFPIPLVHKGDTWQFDTAAGRLEVLYRRIGRNELDTIQACLAYVDAQNDYADKDRGAGAGVYAQRVISQPGKKDGLYWPTAAGEEESPLGEAVAVATAEGYRVGGGRAPFHGYYFKILTKQGANVPGGALDYVVNGKMIGGFALVAYPAEYGNSGVMTFLVNHNGVVWEKDLGERTTQIAEGMTAYNPDQTWRQVGAADLVIVQ